VACHTFFAAAALGLVAAAVYFGSRRPAFITGITISAALPLATLIAAVTGFPLYRDYPLAIALTGSGLEVALAALLIGWWRALQPRY
jgi:zinc transporter ZupT